MEASRQPLSHRPQGRFAVSERSDGYTLEGLLAFDERNGRKIADVAGIDQIAEFARQHQRCRRETPGGEARPYGAVRIVYTFLES